MSNFTKILLGASLIAFLPLASHAMVNCGGFENQGQCEANNCHWTAIIGECGGKPKECWTGLSEEQCRTTTGCYWNNTPGAGFCVNPVQQKRK